MSGAAILPQLYTCPRCTKSLPRDAFGNHAHRPDNRASYCKPCGREKRREQDAAYRAANPTKPRPPPKEQHYCDGCGAPGHNVTTCPDNREAQMARAGLARCPRNCGGLIWTRDLPEHTNACQGPPRLEYYAVRRSPPAYVEGGSAWSGPNTYGR